MRIYMQRDLCDTANQNLEERFASELRDASRPLTPGEYPVSDDYRAFKRRSCVEAHLGYGPTGDSSRRLRERSVLIE